MNLPVLNRFDANIAARAFRRSRRPEPAANACLSPSEAIPNDRELYFRLLDPEAYFYWLPLARDRILGDLSEYARLETDEPWLFQTPLSADAARVSLPAWPALTDLDTARSLIAQFAPSLLPGSCLLKNYWQARNCHTDLAAALFRLYEAGLDARGRDLEVATYRMVLDKAGVELASYGTHAFCEDARISDWAFEYALLRLCLARCAREFPAEAIGFSAADWLAGLGIFDAALRLLNVPGIDSNLLDPRSRAMPRAIPALQDAIAACLQGACDPEESRRRIIAGFRLYVGAERRFRSKLLDSLESKTGAADRVLALFRDKAWAGTGFHRNILIGGKSLDEWLESDIQDGQSFLDALADSAWFDLANPARSLFFTRATAPDGRMAGVFAPNELAVISEWLEARRKQGRALVVSKPHEEIRNSASAPALRWAGFGRLSTRNRPNAREMFHLLVNIDRFPEVLPAARAFVEKCLRWTKLALSVSRNRELQVFSFTHDAFQNRIASIYRRQVDSYRPLLGKPRIDRPYWRTILKQFAPTVLVDGCWLQNTHDPGMDHCAVADSLWQIYTEEIGKGQTRFNHPLIYRLLLESLGVDLPAIDDPDFANHADFIAGAFDIPCYLLAISIFPRSLLPELIGVNLAIELSGLGGSYLSIAESLDYWGIDATIVRIHQSADNMALGHAAIAKSVACRYLDEVSCLSGERVMQEHWQRIWRGFASMRIVPLRLIAGLGWRYVWRSAFGVRRSSASMAASSGRSAS